jgi:phage shock protein A
MPLRSTELQSTTEILVAIPPANSFTLAEIQALRDSANMALRALEDLRGQLAEARKDRDRYIVRVKLLEARLETIREVSSGKWDDRPW